MEIIVLKNTTEFFIKLLLDALNSKVEMAEVSISKFEDRIIALNQY